MEELISPFEQRILTRELEKSFRQGFQQGKQQGKQLGMALVTTRLLRRFLGELPFKLELTIFELSVKKLGDLVEALFDFKTIGNLENWLKDNAPLNSPAKSEVESSS